MVKEYIYSKRMENKHADSDEFGNANGFGDLGDLGICEIRIEDNNSLESPLQDHQAHIFIREDDEDLEEDPNMNDTIMTEELPGISAHRSQSCLGGNFISSLQP